VAGYRGLRVVDAAGSEIPAHLSAAGNSLRVHVQDTTARYPLTVDPWIYDSFQVGANVANYGWSVSTAKVYNVWYFAVGSPAQNGDTGAVYLYRSSPPLTTIKYGTQSGARFGTAVAFAKGIANVGELSLAVGSPNYDVGFSFDEGVVSTYDLTPGLVPEPSRTLIASDGAPYDHLGSSVDYGRAHARIVVAGAPNDNYNSTPDVGSARVWSVGHSQDFPDWHGHDATLVPSNPSSPDQFLGTSVSVVSNGYTGNCLGYCHDVAVGAPGASSGAGTANVYKEPDATWEGAAGNAFSPTRVLSGGAGDRVGYSVAISGDGGTLAMGAHGADAPQGGGADVGAVYVAIRQGGSWANTPAFAVLRHTLNGYNDQLGRTVGISGSGDRIAAGAPFDELSGLYDEGIVYTWDRPANGWVNDSTPNQYFRDETPDYNGKFGANLTVSEDGKHMLIGGPFNPGYGIVQHYSRID
jgi:hypothetical protein